MPMETSADLPNSIINVYDTIQSDACMKNQVSIAAHALYQKLPFVVKYIATKVKAMAIAIVVKEKTCHLFNNVMRMVYMIDILKP